MDPFVDLDNHLNLALENAAALQAQKSTSKNNRFPGEDILTVKLKNLVKYQLNLIKIKKFQSQNPGGSLEQIEDVVFDSTVNRTVLERIRGLEIKIQPKIDNYLKILEEGKSGQAKEMLRSGILDDSDSDDNDDDDDDHGESKIESADNEDMSEIESDEDGDDVEINSDGEIQVKAAQIAGDNKRSTRKTFKVSKSDDEEIDSDEFGFDPDQQPNNKSSEKSSKTQTSSSYEKYRAPKLVSMPYPGDKNSKNPDNFEENDDNNKNKRRAYNTARIAELEDEFGEAPVITVEKGANTISKFKQSKVFREQKQRQIDEEDNYKRYNLTKKQKNKEKAAMTRDEFESISTIAGVDDLLGNERYQGFKDRVGKSGGGKRSSKRGSDLLFKKKKRRR